MPVQPQRLTVLILAEDRANPLMLGNWRFHERAGQGPAARTWGPRYRDGRAAAMRRPNGTEPAQPSSRSRTELAHFRLRRTWQFLLPCPARPKRKRCATTACPDPPEPSLVQPGNAGSPTFPVRAECAYATEEASPSYGSLPADPEKVVFAWGRGGDGSQQHRSAPRPTCFPNLGPYFYLTRIGPRWLPLTSALSFHPNYRA